jgi:citrate lyase subunit beta / citryl-CoA lyase
MSLRPRRSMLYMPGSNPKVLDKARSLPADGLILDLEDAVAPDAKPAARDLVAGWVRAGGFGRREVIVRVNGAASPWHQADVAAGATCGCHGLLFPKVSSADEVAAASALMDQAGAPAEMDLWVMIETPAAILSLGAIAAMAASTRLTGLVLGTNDLAKETGARQTPDRAPFWFALAAAVTAARANGLCVIDGVHNDIADTAGFEAACTQGRDFGFDGKTLIHPGQIATCNQVFAPDRAAIDQARAILAAFEDPANAGKGVLKVNGAMAEILHRDMALATVAIAEAIDAMADGQMPDTQTGP